MSYAPVNDDRVQLRPPAYLLTLLSPNPARINDVVTDLSYHWPEIAASTVMKIVQDLRNKGWTVMRYNSCLILPAEQVEILWVRYQEMETTKGELVV